MAKVGIFAGTFDPIHNGHLAFARGALSQGLDKVYFLIEPRPRRKQGVRALEHRQKMVQLAVDEQQDTGSILLNAARFTPAETLPLLQNRFKDAELWLLFGDDVIHHMVDHLADWPRLDELANSTKLMIATRHEKKDEIVGNLQTIRAITGVDFAYKFVEPKCPDISSSKLRAAIKQGKIPGEMPRAVSEYALENGLYTSG